MPEPSTSHIGQGVALDALAAVLVYINSMHSQIAEMITHLFRHSPVKGPYLVLKSEPSLPKTEDLI
jgi:hypothetical protein